MRLAHFPPGFMLPVYNRNRWKMRLAHFPPPSHRFPTAFQPLSNRFPTAFQPLFHRFSTRVHITEKGGKFALANFPPFSAAFPQMNSSSIFTSYFITSIL
jgi:hypothetical protein